MVETVGRVGKVRDIQLAVEMLHYAHPRADTYDIGIAVDRGTGFHASHDSDAAGRRIGLVSMKQGDFNRAFLKRMV
jgi:hypothetical protein